MATQTKGHEFDFDHDRCVRCGMTRTEFEDAGEPQCTGQQVERSEPRSGFRPDE
jgi:hypothetical protein